MNTISNPSTLLPPPASVVRQRSDSIPRLSQQQQLQLSENNISTSEEYIPPAAPSHKRKQSDIPISLSISPQSSSVFRSSLDLDIYEDEYNNNDNDDNDSIVYSGPVIEESWISWILQRVKKVKIRWLGLGIMILVFMGGGGRRRRRRNGKEYDHDTNTNENEQQPDGYESVGDPIEARVKYNSIEYYSDLNRMGHLISSGPTAVTYPSDHDAKGGTSGAGGMYMYEDVCVTNNVDYPKKPLEDTSLRGLIRFTDDKRILKNERRCVPCTAEETDELLLQSTTTATTAGSKSSSIVGHACGMKGLHEMYASSVMDWNECIDNTENRGLMIRSKQTQSPSHVTNVHFFDRPTFLLQFTANNRESSLFDTLFSYLPHWHHYRSINEYPFDAILSHSVEGCLSHSRNWLCEILHHMSAFGSAKEVIWEETPHTLYCFRHLQVNRMGYQRSLSGVGQITKTMMDDFRDVLFRSMALPRPRDMNEIRVKDAKLGIARPFKIVMYAGNSNHGTNVWENMKELVVEARGMTRYHGVEFTVVDDLDELTVAEQARGFNMADAVIMSTGEHMANAIFATDDTVFVELGCGGFSSIENKHFMGFVLGTHQSVKECTSGDGNSHIMEEACVQCVREGLNSSFSIVEDAFHGVVDGILKAHQDKVAIMRDS